ncbi:MAG: ATP-dependent helicase [Candidatus Eisenbacteria bacterium]|uniref:ATP-dependent helicase n=1 Tax=Eiseniibacteriota bacterium TaxID=2212470 RepID=A0A538SPD5_UNCEI|nr:MAG: ATP-dependent helicase [Candidatus Eisenbacteria bacterium]
MGARMMRERSRAPRAGFRVGDRVHHREFGEGLIVEVRERDGFEVLEIAFPDGIRRLTSLYPLETARGAGRPRAPSVLSAEPAPAPMAGGLAVPARTQFRVAGISEELYRRLAAGPYDEPSDFDLRLRIERFTLHRGFDRLLSLDLLHDVQKYEHQSQACMTVLRRMRGRSLLADEVGLGKTIEAGIILKEYLLRGLVQRALILVPASLVEQWDQELRRKFDLEFAVLKHGTAWWEEPLLLASMDTAKLLRHRDKVAAASFDLVVVDEAHRLKNQKTLAWKFLDRLAPRYLLLLTATPVQNDLHELYNLIQLLRPGLLGTYRTFGREFMRRGDKRMPQNTGRLAALLSETMIRTTRASTSIRFPRREVSNILFDLSPPERDLYDNVTRFVRRVLHAHREPRRGAIKLTLLTLQKEMGSSTFAAIPTLSKLLAREGPGLERSEMEDLLRQARSIETNAKFEGIAKLLGGSRDKCVIFTQFRATLEFLARSLRQLGIKVAVFHGALSLREKEAAIEQFRDRARVLVSTEAGGEGRNLQFCHYLVNYDLPWNPMRIEQRIGRLHRLGQTQDVKVFNFTARNTVESYVLQIVHEKINLFRTVIGDLDMVLGPYAEAGSFEDEVFRIWAAAKGERDLEREFAKLGTALLVGRKRYEAVEELDRKLLDEVDQNGPS